MDALLVSLSENPIRTLAPSDEGAGCPQGQTGGENKSIQKIPRNDHNFNLFSPSVADGDSSLGRLSLGRYRARRFIVSLKRSASGWMRSLWFSGV